MNKLYSAPQAAVIEIFGFPNRNSLRPRDSPRMAK